MTSVGPSRRINCCFFRLLNSLVTVSRDEPMRCAISSWGAGTDAIVKGRHSQRQRLRQQQPGQLARGRTGEDPIANVGIRGLKVPTRTVGGVNSDLGLRLQKFEQMLAIDEAQRAPGRGLGGNFKARARDWTCPQK